MPNKYRGRFAPTPSGPLHFGSLIAALASWLDARANSGEWHLRIEDIDPPRIDLASESQILETLHCHGLHWDAISHQSGRYDHYRAALKELQQLGLVYACNCSRAEIRSAGGHQDHWCRAQNIAATEGVALRFCLTEQVSWPDLIQGPSQFCATDLDGDFVVLRRDGLFSYQLAVAVDDHEQTFSHVIRGDDLFDSTARQLMLLNALNRKAPKYGHFPVALDEQGLKLSKQNHAPAVDNSRACENLLGALRFLGQNTESLQQMQTPEVLLEQAITHWNLSLVPARAGIHIVDWN